ncbi:MAG: hypothetical protein ACREMP_09600 [Candidatus Tyrphobacter sp.]
MKLRLCGFAIAVALLVVLRANTAAAAPPDPAISSMLGGLLAAVNANDAARVDTYFAADAVVVDEIAPYEWTGPHVGLRWWRAVDATSARMHVKSLHARALPITQWHLSNGQAYVVLPLVLTSTVHGKTSRETGLWTFTLRRRGSAWAVETVTWSTQSSH